MDTSILDFLKIIDQENRSMIDRAIALLWWTGRADPRLGMTAKDIAGVLEAGGHPMQNVSRLERQLAEEREPARLATMPGDFTRQPGASAIVTMRSRWFLHRSSLGQRVASRAVRQITRVHRESR